MDQTLLAPSGVFCTNCGDAIPVGRIQALPTAKTCVSCSKSKKVQAYQYIHGKTGHVWMITDAKTADRIERAQARKGQSPGAAMRGHSKLY